MNGCPPAVVAAAGRFLPGPLERAEPVGGGYIHDSWRCRVGDTELLLQRLNTRVFAAPHLVMENVARVARHLAEHDHEHPEVTRRSLTLLPTGDGAHTWVDEAGGWWRAYRFIPDSRVLEKPETTGHALQTGRLFGRFHRVMARYDGPRLHETIPHFHDTPRRLAALRTAALEDHAGRADSARREIAAMLAQAPAAGRLQALRAQGLVPERIAHNDAKIGNVLFDAATDEALCVVDLDTVMPGQLLHDFGDLIRSTAPTGAEDEPDPARVKVSLPMFGAILTGFLAEAGALLVDAERAHLVDAAQLVTLEQAARFLTDYLNGDRYYRVERPGQNLDRAKAQLALFDSLVEEEDALRAMTR